MTHQEIPTAPDLAILHDHYVEAVNSAVAEDRMDLVATLAAEYDREAAALSINDTLHAA